MSKKKCPDCGAPVRSYHNPGITRLVCSAKCRGWHVIETINHTKLHKQTACRNKAHRSKFKGSIVELNDFLECGKCDYLECCLIPQYFMEM